jgi:site-specific recombinase XerD
MAETALILMLTTSGSSDEMGVRYLKAISISAVKSVHSKRAYATAIEEFISWNLCEGKIRITARELLTYQAHLIERTNPTGQPLAPSTVNVKMAAVRSLVHSAATDEWISKQDEEQILSRVQSCAVKGRRQGHRMPLEDVIRCLRLPDRSTIQGKRDYAILAVLFSCGIRRAELCSVEVKTIGKLDGGWAFIDLVGKRQKVRSVPMEDPVKDGIDEWLAAAKITKGRIFRAINRGGNVWGTGLSTTVIWNIVKHYAGLVGYPTFAPHDARRSCARIYYDHDAPLVQIQLLLGHDKLDTTANYINAQQKFGAGALGKVVDIS